MTAESARNPVRIRRLGRAWLMPLTLSWIWFQAADLLLTYWGLTSPLILEANPVMAPLIQVPLAVVGIKAGLTLCVSGLLRWMEYHSDFTTVPILLGLNLLMGYVFVNNWSAIVWAGLLSL